MKPDDLQPSPGWTLARRAGRMNSSAIREILKVTEQPGIISFAGGLPSPTVEGPTNDLTDSGILLLETAFLLQPFWGLWLGRALLAPPKPTASARP